MSVIDTNLCNQSQSYGQMGENLVCKKSPIGKLSATHAFDFKDPQGS
jgi:hypothetical protein